MNLPGTFRFRRRGPGLLDLVAATTVALCSVYVFYTAGHEEKRLRILAKQGVESVALKEIAQQYSDYKGVTVEVVQLPYDAVYEREMRQLDAARNGKSLDPFDIFMVDDPWLYALAKGGGLKKVSRLLKGSETDFFPSTLKVASYCPLHGDCSEYYAVPFVANSQLFVFRAADFPKSRGPATWEEVLVTSEKIQRRQDGCIGYVTRIGPGNSIVTDFMPILWAYDPASFPEFLGQGDPLKHPEGAFATLKKLVATREKLGSASFDDFDVSAYLEKRRASMGIAWSAWAMMLVDLENNQTQSGLRAGAYRIEDCTAKLVADVDSNHEQAEDLIFTDIPHSSTIEKLKLSADAIPGPELGVWLLAVPSDAPQSNLALDFISYAVDLGGESTSPKRSLLTAQSGTPPPRISVLAQLAKDKKYQQHPSLIPAIERSLKAGRPRPRTPCWREIESRLGPYLETLIEECVKPEDITRCANRDLTPLFNSDKCEALPDAAEIACFEKATTTSGCNISKQILPITGN